MKLPLLFALALGLFGCGSEPQHGILETMKAQSNPESKIHVTKLPYEPSDVALSCTSASVGNLRICTVCGKASVSGTSLTCHTFEAGLFH